MIDVKASVQECLRNMSEDDSAWYGSSDIGRRNYATGKAFWLAVESVANEDDYQALCSAFEKFAPRQECSSWVDTGRAQFRRTMVWNQPV